MGANKDKVRNQLAEATISEVSWSLFRTMLEYKAN